MTVKQITDIAPLLSGAKLGKMTAEGRYKYIKALRAVKAVADEFEAVRADAVEQCKHPEFDAEVAAYNKAREGQALSEDEARMLTRFVEFDRDVTAIVRQEADRGVRLDFARLTEDELSALLDSNPDWTAQQIMDVEDILR